MPDRRARDLQTKSVALPLLHTAGRLSFHARRAVLRLAALALGRPARRRVRAAA